MCPAGNRRGATSSVQALRGEYGHLMISGLHEIGRGMDARVYRASSPELGPVAIRMPHNHWVTSGTEPQLDTRRKLRQDYRLSRHLHADDAGTDFTIAQYIEAGGQATTWFKAPGQVALNAARGIGGLGR